MSKLSVREAFKRKNRKYIGLLPISIPPHAKICMGSPGMLYLNAPVISKFCVLTLLHPGGGKNLSPDETHVISPEPNIRLTPDHPVNSYLSVSNQGKKTRALHLSRFNFGGPIKCKSTFFLQGGTLAKLSKFELIKNFSKNY